MSQRGRMHVGHQNPSMGEGVEAIESAKLIDRADSTHVAYVSR